MALEKKAKGLKVVAEVDGGKGKVSSDVDALQSILLRSGGTHKSANFYLYSSDTKGHSDVMSSLKVPQGMSGAFARLREVYPEYRTNADIVRDALVHLWYMRMSGDQESGMMDVWRTTGEIEAHRHKMQAKANMIKQARSVMEEAVEEKDKVQLEDILDVLEGTIEVTGGRYRENLEKLYDEFAGKLRRMEN